MNSRQLDNQKFECIAMRFREKVIYTHNNGKLITEDPAITPPGFTRCDAQTTLASSATISATGSAPNGAFLSDYQQDSEIDTFYNYFGLEKTASNINDIKSEYHQINLSSSIACASEIQNAFVTLNKKKVWVTGDCVIFPSLLVQDGGGSVIPKSLVLENGIFLSSGSTVFDGSFYHMVNMNIFDDPNSSGKDLDLLSDRWSDAIAQDANLTALSSLVEANSIYIDNGSFFPKGGISFDYPGGLSTIKGSLNLDYLSQYNPHDNPLKVTWKGGSWNDL